jgi:hypothetical protein
MKTTIRIARDVESLTQEEHETLAALLEKAGFEVAIGGGASDFCLELNGPGFQIRDDDFGWTNRLVVKTDRVEFALATASHPDTLRDLRKLGENLNRHVSEFQNEYVTAADGLHFEIREPLSISTPNHERRPR